MSGATRHQAPTAHSLGSTARFQCAPGSTPFVAGGRSRPPDHCSSSTWTDVSRVTRSPSPPTRLPACESSVRLCRSRHSTLCRSSSVARSRRQLPGAAGHGSSSTVLLRCRRRLDAARVLGPHSGYIGDDYAFAHTSPVYGVRAGHRYVKPDDVRFLDQTLAAIWSRVEQSRWRSDAQRERFRIAVDSTRAVYARLAP